MKLNQGLEKGEGWGENGKVVGLTFLLLSKYSHYGASTNNWNIYETRQLNMII